MALTMHLQPSNYSVGHKRLEHIPGNHSSQHCVINPASQASPTSMTEPADAIFGQLWFLLAIQNHYTIATLYTCHRVYNHKGAELS